MAWEGTVSGLGINYRTVLLLSTAAMVATAVTSSAEAGGFALREQSASSQGASFAGNATGWDLSSMFWNSAAVTAKNGLNTESHYSLILPEAEVTVTSFTAPPGPIAGAIGAAPPNSGDIAPFAIVPSSYGSYQVGGPSGNLFVGIGINSAFGLTTKPENIEYQGSVLGRTSKLFSMNANPTLGYRIAPGISIGVGAQVQYSEGTFKFATGIPQNPSSFFKGDDWAFGATAGILIEPAAGTAIGLGWRSQLSHELDGRFASNGFGLSTASQVELNLPDIVTLSVRQSVTPSMRVMGTVEWSNWSRFKELRVVSKETDITVLGFVTPGDTIGNIEANWSDGWFFSLGGEYDYSQSITLRAGAAYELSPVDSPEKRIVGIPDSDRIWLSIGATYRYSESMSFDLAHTHIFLEDAEFERTTLSGIPMSGTVEASTDIISASMKTRW